MPQFGVTKIVPLKENGEKISVSLDNRKEFVQLSAQYRLYSSIKEQIEALLGGFYEIIPKELVSIVSPLGILIPLALTETHPVQ